MSVYIPFTTICKDSIFLTSFNTESHLFLSARKMSLILLYTTAIDTVAKCHCYILNILTLDLHIPSSKVNQFFS